MTFLETRSYIRNSFQLCKHLCACALCLIYRTAERYREPLFYIFRHVHCRPFALLEMIEARTSDTIAHVSSNSPTTAYNQVESIIECTSSRQSDTTATITLLLAHARFLEYNHDISHQLRYFNETLMPRLEQYRGQIVQDESASSSLPIWSRHPDLSTIHKQSIVTEVS